ncbi:MAG: hypothetical protein LBG87_02775 [Spirochaetaceae bacterium]|jgi:hypothetical protein|nr:hypothetical protein [Spirochaetaceae bacterium]
MKKIFLLEILFLLGLSLSAQNRSFADLFPRLDSAQREEAFSAKGLYLYGKTRVLQLTPVPESGIDISGPILSRNLSYLAECLMVIQTPKPVGFAAIYNALGNVRGLKGREYHSFTRNKYIPLFEDATRIVSDKKLAPIPDPQKVASVPAEETAYIRLKDANFGNIYYRAELAASPRNLLYTLSNFKSVYLFLIPVIKENKFVAQLYFEILAEGVLLYGIAGADVSDFAASQIDMPSAIQKRLDVIIQWVVDGIAGS